VQRDAGTGAQLQAVGSDLHAGYLTAFGGVVPASAATPEREPFQDAQERAGHPGVAGIIHR